MREKNKYIVISDLHLSHEFNDKLFLELKKIIQNSTNVIINGDFWDDSKTTFEKFVNSKWNMLFPLLKERKTIYITGNHDPIYKINKKFKLFAEKLVQNITIKHNNQDFYITHGQEYSVVTKIAMKIAKKNTNLVKFLGYPMFLPMYINEKFILRQKEIKSLFKTYNKKYKNKFSNKILVMGHTHIPEIDFENMYINTGFINKDVLHYLQLGSKVKLNKHKINS